MTFDYSGPNSNSDDTVNVPEVKQGHITHLATHNQSHLLAAVTKDGHG